MIKSRGGRGAPSKPSRKQHTCLRRKRGLRNLNTASRKRQIRSTYGVRKTSRTHPSFSLSLSLLVSVSIFLCRVASRRAVSHEEALGGGPEALATARQGRRAGEICASSAAGVQGDERGRGSVESARLGGEGLLRCCLTLDEKCGHRPQPGVVSIQSESRTTNALGTVSRRIGSADDAGGMSLPHSRNHISLTTEVLSLFSSLSPSTFVLSRRTRVDGCSRCFWPSGKCNSSLS